MKSHDTRALARRCASQWLTHHGVHHRLLFDQRGRGYDIVARDNHNQLTERIAVEGRQSPIPPPGKKPGNNNAFELKPYDTFYWCLWLLFSYDYTTYTPFLLPRQAAIRLSHVVTHDNTTGEKRYRVPFDTRLIRWMDNHNFYLIPPIDGDEYPVDDYEFYHSDNDECQLAKYPSTVRPQVYGLIDDLLALD